MGWLDKQIEKSKKAMIAEAERLHYTAQKGSPLDLIWKGEFNNNTNMSKTTKKGFDVPAGFPTPLTKSAILEKVKLENRTKGGILLDESSEDNNVAIVMAISPDCINAQFVKPGDKVMYNLNEKRTIRHDENTYLIVHDLSLICKLNDSILMVESVDSNVKRKQSKLDGEQKRINNMAKIEANQVDKINEKAKKKFGRRR